jgi:hypothetical protein
VSVGGSGSSSGSGSSNGNSNAQSQSEEKRMLTKVKVDDKEEMSRVAMDALPFHVTMHGQRNFSRPACEACTASISTNESRV